LAGLVECRPRLGVGEDASNRLHGNMGAVRSRRVVCLIAAVLLGAACTSGAAVSTTTSSPATSTTTSLPTVDLSATPAGWVAVAYGDGQISVPASWSVQYLGSGCFSVVRPGTVWIGVGVGPLPTGCPPPFAVKDATLLHLHRLTRPSDAWAGETPFQLNDLVVYRGDGDDPYIGGYDSPGHSYDYIVPALGVEVKAVGPRARQIIDTLTRSPRGVALASGPATSVPPSWRSVTFAGLRLSVPATWTVRRTRTWNICGPVQIALSKGVILDTDQTFLRLPCVSPPLHAVMPSDGVRVDSGRRGPTGSFSPGGTCLRLHGLSACPSSTPDYSILLLRVTVAISRYERQLPLRARPVYVSIGLAGNGLVARAILYSLRAA